MTAVTLVETSTDVAGVWGAEVGCRGVTAAVVATVGASGLEFTTKRDETAREGSVGEEKRLLGLQRWWWGTLPMHYVSASSRVCCQLPAALLEMLFASQAAPNRSIMQVHVVTSRTACGCSYAVLPIPVAAELNYAYNVPVKHKIK